MKMEKPKPIPGYEFESIIGRGQAKTWTAICLENDEQVVVKTLELSTVENWKGIELFEREARVLEQLRHPFIPAFIDFIKEEEENTTRWHLIQEKAEGENLHAYLKEEKIDENFLKTISLQILEILVYLQSFSPPLLHRDIKPENLIIDAADKIWLVDFGSVRHVVPSRHGGSTIVGTSGFMAPEQLLGRANRSSDLYALGMVLVNLITKTDPGALPNDGFRVDWESRSKMDLSATFRAFLTKLVAPHQEDRFVNADQALHDLKFGKAPSDKKNALVELRPNTPAKVPLSIPKWGPTLALLICLSLTFAIIFMGIFPKILLILVATPIPFLGLHITTQS